MGQLREPASGRGPAAADGVGQWCADGQALRPAGTVGKAQLERAGAAASPDPGASAAERCSAWARLDPLVLSAGGGSLGDARDAEIAGREHQYKVSNIHN